MSETAVAEEDDRILFQVTRGKLKNKVLQVHQMCNDWITANDPDTGELANGGQPINPSSTYFSWGNRHKVMDLNKAGQLGQMFRLYYDINTFLFEGKFKKIKII